MTNYPKEGQADWGPALKQYIDSIMGSSENVRLAREQVESTVRDLLALMGNMSGVENVEALASWRSVDTASTTAKVVLIGDSISDGGLASTFDSTIARRLQATLRVMVGRTGGAGYIQATPSTEGAIVPGPPNTRAGTAVMWAHGLGGRAMYLGEAAHHVTYNPTQFTQIKVHYGKTSVAGGALRVLVDGVDQGVVLSSSAASNSSGHIWTSPAFPKGTRTVRIEPVTPPYVGILEGVEFINDDETSGVRVYNGAHSGGTVAAYNQSNMGLHWQSVAAINPNLAIVNLGTNDIASSTVPAFLSGMATMLAKIPSHIPILLVGNYLRGDYNTPAGRTKWSEMQAGLRAMATGRIAYIDLAPHWPELVADGSTSEGLMFDTPPIHPNDAGMKKITDVLAAAVGPTSNLAFVGPRGPKGATGDLTPASQTILDTAVADAEDARDEAEAAAQAAADLLVSSSSLTLSAASPTVPALSNVNEWTVSDAVQVDLPVVNPGSQYTVHVASGFQNLTWPNGTTVYGETDQQDVWVTLIRGDTGWNVLIPSPAAEASAAGLDTGWVALAAGYNFGTPTWSVDPGSALGTGWGLPVGSAGGLSIRRMGNMLHVRVDGLGKVNATISPLFTLPAGITAGNEVYSSIVSSHSMAAPNAYVLRRLTYTASSRNLTVSEVNGDTAVAEGTVLGKGSGTNVYGSAVISFPLAPSSTWGT